jgi:predicted acetyltransferase
VNGNTDIAVPRLSLPAETVRTSFLDAAQELAAEGTLPDFELEQVSGDFSAYVREHRQLREGWGVPYTELWYVAGAEYLGTVTIRHRLTPDLLEIGGHIGYHVAPRHRRQGHATGMLREALVFCRGLRLDRVLVTTVQDNLASRRVIEANGGHLEDVRHGECRYWLHTGG